jgi:hypothetical protein
MKLSLLSVFMAGLLASCRSPKVEIVEPGLPTGRFSQNMFQRALHNLSTTPDHILITIQGHGLGSRTLRCVESKFLIGALHTQLGLGYGDAEIAEVVKVAEQCYGRTVILTKRKALRNVPQWYIGSELDAARSAIAGLSPSDRMNLTAISRLSGFGSALPRQAVAHALLERGIMVTRGCVSNSLTPHK